MKRYIPSQVEPKWQKKWAEDKLYLTKQDPDKPKKYVLDMFPYPSGDRLHVGHLKGYIATDIISRYFRLKGFNVLHPMGWDAFGLPAENYALKTGIHPKISTSQNIVNMKKQMGMVALSYDWSREINTTDSNYYKWTQWIFLKMFEKGLAYEDEIPINWCPSCKTGLANEEVIAGECERCGTKVEQKKLRQWILRITKYADWLLEDLEGLDWPEAIKEMQTNWIGKSKGALIKFDGLEVFTTRVDTIFGATFLVISPEHPLLEQLVTLKQKVPVHGYKESVKKKSELERKEGKEKTGVFTGSFVRNPLTGEDIPVWVADYVLPGYGTGAIMAVPDHDARDFEFAKKFDLGVRQVIEPAEGVKMGADGLFEGEGILINSGEFSGLTSAEAKKKLTNYLEEHQLGRGEVQYHLRDWVFSRQRYWGEPIPLIHCQKCGVVAVPEEQLPLQLPEVEKYEPTGTGESPLANITEWVNTTCPKCGGPAKRETNTMPQWAGSCWYYLRFIDPKNDQQLVNAKLEKYWMPVDWYVGGAEHAVLHLLYARFWHKFLFDLGLVSTKEPFGKLTNVGLVLATDGRKMSKRWGNVVVAEEIVKEYGADTLRVYEGFMGPFENTISWDPSSINGVYRFLTKVWDVINKDDVSEASQAVERSLNRLIKKVGEDIETVKLNTAIAAMMEFINRVLNKGLTSDQKKRFLIILAPFAPHITEELWEMLREKYSIHQQSWPKFDEKYLEEEEVTIVVQVNGRVRDQLVIQKEIVDSSEEVERRARESQKVQNFLDGKEIKKSIYVTGKVLNLVV